MDTSADPCVDFYQYSCGGWNARNPFAILTTRFGELRAQNRESLRDVIQSGRDGDVRAVQLAKQFFDSCTDTELLDAMGSRPLVQLVRSIGGWSLINILNSEYSTYKLPISTMVQCKNVVVMPWWAEPWRRRRVTRVTGGMCSSCFCTLSASASIHPPTHPYIW